MWRSTARNSGPEATGGAGGAGCCPYGFTPGIPGGAGGGPGGAYGGGGGPKPGWGAGAPPPGGVHGGGGGCWSIVARPPEVVCGSSVSVRSAPYPSPVCQLDPALKDRAWK
ncbi:hypothetical protein SGFS_045950 [Streptomyces graminofaciens]|uniref:Uncharacterized protein n=1 Tax=Streptomyces graminofaciens TaxID=68212 RepID=A0ABN5VMR2_9ACTN|nr:hypothetical protein SGFS_045950 [Streptomyces graminofaciens]